MSSVTAVRRGAHVHPFRVLLAALAMVGILALVVRVAAGPLAAVRRVTVSGDAPLPEPELLAVAGVAVGQSLLAVDTAAVRARLEAVPGVRSATVRRLPSGTVSIVLSRRQAVALVLAESGSRSHPALVDADGVVFAEAGPADDLPVVSGVTAGIGDRLPQRLLGLLADLGDLQRRAPALLRAVSEVRVEPVVGDLDSPGPLELLVWLVVAPVPLRATALDERLVQYGLLAVDLLSGGGLLRDIREFDLRGGEVVYRMKEG